jgi:hypothetical protein
LQEVGQDARDLLAQRVVRGPVADQAEAVRRERARPVLDLGRSDQGAAGGRVEREVLELRDLGSARKRARIGSNSDRPSSLRTSPIFASAISAPVTMSLLRSPSSACFNAGTIFVRIVSSEGR